MAEVTYYFNAYTVPVWANIANLVDGDTGTFASAGTKKTEQTLTGNTCPGDDLGTITKVELRVYAYGDGNDRIDITPIFTGGNGNAHPTTPVVSPGDWTSYVAITNDPNHPDWSLWSHIQDFDCIIDNVPVAKANPMYCAKVEIRVTYTPPPDPPTNVAATNGAHTDKVVITWTKSAGATQYQVYRDGIPLGWLGDVDTYDDTGADAPTITPGTASASDGISPDYVSLSLSGQSANNGTTHTYKVRAKSAAGESEDSETDTGYRGVGALTYQWQRSATDSDANYSNISGATTESYDDTGAPFDGSGRYYRCVENATEAVQQISAVDRGYRAWEPPDIDVGADPIDRSFSYAAGTTIIDKSNPANASGILHSIKIWATNALFGLVVGTFYTTDGNTLKCRDSEVIPPVTAGSEQTITGLSIAIEQGDYIGCYFTSGDIEYDMSGFASVWLSGGNHTDPGDEESYAFRPECAISLYGYGDIEAPPVGQPYISRVQRIAGMRTMGVNQIG